MIVDAETLRRHVTVLAGDIGERNVFRPASLKRAAEYISGEWADQGYRVTRQTFTVDGILCQNVQVTREGDRDPDRLILVGAHYDSVIGSPGANDNGSGVAALIELARAFSTFSSGCSVRFIAFVNEEPPFFMTPHMGSLVSAREARRRGDRIAFMMCLETIGYYSDVPGSQSYPPLYRFFYPDRGNFIAMVSNMRSRRAMLQMARAFRRHSDFPLESATGISVVPGIAWSDHAAFWDQGFRAFMVTDTAPFRYPYYHTAEDTPDKVDYASLSRVVSGLGDALAERVSVHK